METLLITVLTLCSLGVLAALVLFFVARRFRVEEDPRIDEVERMLPGANCGGCGFAGCRGLADALVGRDDIAGLYCPVGGAECMKRVAAYLGKSAPRSRRRRRRWLRRHVENVPHTNRFDGVRSCAVGFGALLRARRRAATFVWGYRRLRWEVLRRALAQSTETGLPVEWDPSAARRARLR